MNRLTLIRHTCMGVVLAGLLATGASAQGPDPTPQPIDRQQDRQDLRHDRQDRNADNRDIRHDNRDIHHDQVDRN